MSIVDATKKLLSIRKRAMGNPEIARELKAGGLAMSSVDPVNTIGSVLTRRFNQVGDVVKISRGTWGLKEWYPNRTFKPSGKPAPASEPTDDDDENSPLAPNPPLTDAMIDDLIGGGPSDGR
jgi:DNA-directed RNA polymerase delta subunit